MYPGNYIDKELFEVRYTPLGVRVYSPMFDAKYLEKYATGGIADFTGPAWLDGTKSKPEAVLNPLQTQHFIEFVNVLDSIFSESITPSSKDSSFRRFSEGDTYQFNIEVSQMANDYDVDKLVSRIEEKMVKAGKYRNVNIVKKTK